MTTTQLPQIHSYMINDTVWVTKVDFADGRPTPILEGRLNKAEAIRQAETELAHHKPHSPAQINAKMRQLRKERAGLDTYATGVSTAR